MRLRNKYIGTVTAESFTVDREGERIPGASQTGRYILYLSWLGFRRYKKVGDPGLSVFAEDIRARVEAWKRGGPLPPLDADTVQRESAPVIRLINGGKEG